MRHNSIHIQHKKTRKEPSKIPIQKHIHNT